MKPDSEHVEYLALGHPVVDDLVSRATSAGYPGSAAAFVVTGDEGLAATTGWLVVYELGVPSLKEVRELTPIFVTDSGTVDTSLGQRLLERTASFPEDEPLMPTDIPGDELDSALAAAESVGYARLQELEAQAHRESERQLGRERAKLAAYFDYRRRAARDRLESSRRVLTRLQSADTADTRRILPVWRANVARDERLIQELETERMDRLSLLEQRATSSGDLRLVAVSRVEIVQTTGA